MPTRPLACLIVVAALAASLVAAAANAPGFQLSPDRSQLLLITGPRSSVPAPRISKNQAGFDQPAQSPDGRTLGWLALQYRFGHQYVSAEQLVLYRDGKVLRVFDSEQPILSWGFALGGEAVAWSQPTAADSAARHYSLVRIRDGVGLGDWQCQLADAAHASPQVAGEAPDWVRAIAQGCPLQ